MKKRQPMTSRKANLSILLCAISVFTALAQKFAPTEQGIREVEPRLSR